MSGFLFFDASQLVILDDLVDVAEEEGTSLRKSAAKIGQLGVRRMKDNITNGDFEPLSPAYAIRKAKAGKGSKPILVWYGTMRDSITYNLENDDTTLTIGPTDIKAPYHASDLPRSKMPLRDFISLDEDFMDEAAEVFMENVVQQVEARASR